MKRVLSMLFFMAVAIALMPGQSMASDDFTDLTVPELKQIIDSGQKIVLLNSLSEVIYNQGHIPGSTNIHLEELETTTNLPADKNTLIVTYCLGPKWWIYKKAARAVAKRGYTNVKTFKAGVPDWVKAGYKLDTSKAVPKVKIPGLTPQQLDAKRSSVTIVDLRMGKTISGMGLFPGAVLVPMPKLTKMIDKINKSKPIVLIDYNGKQFPSVGSYLKANGFSDVSGLQGGLTNWLQQGFTLQQ